MVEYTVQVTAERYVPPTWRIVAVDDTLGALRTALAELEARERVTVGKVYDSRGTRVSVLGPDHAKVDAY